MPKEHTDPQDSPGYGPIEHAYAVLMAGGSGTRFWPLSRRKQPKQLLQIFGEGSMLEQAVARVSALIPAERIYTFTNTLLRSRIVKMLPQIPARQIVAEPAARNTAPTIGMAAHEILRRDPHGLMIVLPSDHVIARQEEFEKVLRAGCEWAREEGRSVTVGLRPTRPDTGFGYVRLGAHAASLQHQEIYRVREFKEKPPFTVARRYVLSGNYLWNGGMFIWKASTLIHNLKRFQPAMARQLAAIAARGGVRSAAFKRLYPELEKISIDFALMERISDVYAVAADIGWSDVGSWAVAYELNPKNAHGNVAPQNSLALDSRGNLILAPRKFVVTVGVQNLVIVDTPDALLVGTLERCQDVGKAVQELEKLGHKHLL